MSIITVSADYYGKAIWKVQRKDNIPVAQFAHLLDCDAKQLRSYIFGVDLIPHDKLQRVFKYAAMMDAMLQEK